MLEESGRQAREVAAEAGEQCEAQAHEIAELRKVQESLLRDVELKHAAEASKRVVV